jgi:hypothetical protein
MAPSNMLQNNQTVFAEMANFRGIDIDEMINFTKTPMAL